ncbi:MAG: HAD family hydrolase [Bacteroidales bacterium]|nr:HAD family hydrolase [Bacteroidales bacterium]
MNNLILLDIDGTLIKGKFKRSSEAFYENIKMQAIKEVYKINVNIDWRIIQGKTDQQIIIDALTEANLNRYYIKQYLNKCIDTIIEKFADNLDDYYAEPLQGVKNLLDIFRAKGELIGLVTGNIEKVARMKLNKAGIMDYFEFGGFGNEDILRSKLIRNAIDKASSSSKFQKKDNVYYFGDSPKDIQAAKEANVYSVAVATGVYDVNELKEHQPDILIEEYSDSSINKVIKSIYYNNY